MAIHRLLPPLWSWCRSEKGDGISPEDLQLWDEDAADADPALKQKIRMSKVQQMVNEESSGDTW